MNNGSKYGNTGMSVILKALTYENTNLKVYTVYLREGRYFLMVF